MDSFALVVHDEQTFLAKVVNYGMEQGIFTRDRADEIIRISVAMANKYVLHKEVDFRSTEELAKVQETVLKLIGVGLEIRSKGELGDGIKLLMEASPVELFRVAHTRIERLRHRWRNLLQNHRIEILVSSEEYDSLSEFTCQRLSEMSVFTETEVHTIASLTLDDELFTALTLLEYYESELERYEFILRLKDILPFGLLNRSPAVRAENLSEVDSIRHALINTVIISGYLDLENPIAVTTADARRFLELLDRTKSPDLFPEELEDVVIDLVHELGEGLEESEGALLAKEVIESARVLMETLANEWETVRSRSESTFFKRWSRMVILSDFPDPMERILASYGLLDEFDFEIILDQVMTRDKDEAIKLIGRLPWNRMNPAQITQLFHTAHPYQVLLAASIPLEGFTAQELVDFLEGIAAGAFQGLLPSLQSYLGAASLTLEDLEHLAGLPAAEARVLLHMANPPADFDQDKIITEFRDGSEKIREILFYTAGNTAVFPELFLEAWSADSAFVKKQIKSIPPSQIGAALLRAAGGRRPEIVKSGGKTTKLVFHAEELNSLFNSLSSGKKKAAVEFFSRNT
ncbi:MAG: hypothetical protein HY914_14000 [Desulfomonile tiedjei]|nr:hypothetical protein [Desulfomonile tiedjei]